MEFAKGTVLTWNSQAVAKLTSVGTPEITVGSIDSTTHDVSGNYRTFIPGLADSGNVAISGYFDPTDTTGQAAMLTDAAARTIRTAIVTGPSSLFSLTFSAFITNLKLVGDAPIDNGYPFTATLKITGAVVFAVGASTGMSTVAFSESGVVAPTFATGTFEYIVTFANGVTSMTVTPTAGSHTITVTANSASQTVTSGEESSAISLGAGGSIRDVVVDVQESGKVKKTYTFHCVQAAS